MNRSLRSAIGIVALVVATMVSANEVNAQSNYTFNTGWYVQPTQQLYQGIQTLPQVYYFRSQPAPTYSPQPYQVYRPQTQLQNWSWSPQVAAPTIGFASPQTFSNPTFSQPTVVRSTPQIQTTAGVTGCSSGT